jgi:hypothetical protein
MLVHLQKSEELMNNMKKISIISGITLAIVISILTWSVMNTNQEGVRSLPLIPPEPTGAEILPAPEVNGCFTSIEDLSTKPTIPVRIPHLLPTGYKLQAVDHIENSYLALYYWDKPLCPFEYTSRDYALKGVIVITLHYPTTYPAHQQITEPKEYVQRIIEHGKGAVDWREITLGGSMNGNIAAGVGPHNGKSIFYENGVIVKEEPISAPAKIYFIHQIDRIEYTISANMPLDDLIKVVESIY